MVAESNIYWAGSKSLINSQLGMSWGKFVYKNHQYAQEIGI